MASLEFKGYSADDISKTLGAVAIGAYVLGYVVLAFHMAKFGFSPASAFHPRILETGICTLIFLALPILSGAALAHIPHRGLSRLQIFMLSAACVPMLSLSLSGILGFTQEGLPISSQDFLALPKSHSSFVLSLIVVGAIVFMAMTLFSVSWAWRNYHRRPIRSFLVLIPFTLTFTLMGSGSWRHGQADYFWWFMGLSLLTLAHLLSTGEFTNKEEFSKEIDVAKKAKAAVKRMLAEARGQICPEDDMETAMEDDAEPLTMARLISLEIRIDCALERLTSGTSMLHLQRSLSFYAPITIFSYVIATLAAWTFWVFPHVPFKFGGGEIPLVTLFESEAGKPNRTIKAAMLDQSEQGFFIVLPGHDKGIFIPKERVVAIYFSDGQIDFDKLIE